MAAEKRLTPYEKAGGRDKIAKVAKVFYDKVYGHPWIGQYFKKVPQEHIESQQVDFVAGILNGPRNYGGLMPHTAHEHMMITEELFDLRNQLLEEALDECGIPVEVKEIWLKADRSFKDVIVKKDISDCRRRYVDEPILDFKKP